MHCMSATTGVLVESGVLERDSGSREGDLEVLRERLDMLRCLLFSCSIDPLGGAWCSRAQQGVEHVLIHEIHGNSV